MADEEAGSATGLPEEPQGSNDDWVIPVPATGTPAFAVMPWALFQRLRRMAADAGPAALHRDGIAIRSGGEIGLIGGLDRDDPFADDGSDFSAEDGFDDGESIPLAVLDRLLDGEHPLKVFRRYRGLSQKELAARTGLNATYLSQIETRKRGGSTRVYRLLAAALNVDIGDLIE